MEGGIKVSPVSGKGLLDARALYATTIGPFRLAMASRKPVTLFNNKAVEVAKNLGIAEAYVFIGMGLIFEAVVNPLALQLSKDDSIGVNSGLPVLLTGQVAGGFGFMQLLLPGEQLFAQIADPNVAQQNVVVAQVVF